MRNRKEYDHAYYMAHKTEIKANYKKNRTAILAYQKEYNRGHTKKRSVYNKAYWLNREEERKAYHCAYRKRTRSKTNKYARDRRAAIKAGTWVFKNERKPTFEDAQQQKATQKPTKEEVLRARQHQKDIDKIESIRMRWCTT